MSHLNETPYELSDLSKMENQIFCCGAAVPVYTPENNKPFNDQNRELHRQLLESFLDFANRRRHALDAHRVTETAEETVKRIITSLMAAEPEEPYKQVVPNFTLENLTNNPLDPGKTLYCIHLTSRKDYGPVRTHRYFMCPDLSSPTVLWEDWTELTLVHWYAQGYPYKMTVEQLDVKCGGEDEMFYRVELMPNLRMRACIPVPVANLNEGNSIGSDNRVKS